MGHSIYSYNETLFGFVAPRNMIASSQMYILSYDPMMMPYGCNLWGVY